MTATCVYFGNIYIRLKRLSAFTFIKRFFRIRPSRNFSTSCTEGPPRRGCVPATGSSFKRPNTVYPTQLQGRKSLFQLRFDGASWRGNRRETCWIWGFFLVRLHTNVQQQQQQWQVKLVNYIYSTEGEAWNLLMTCHDVFYLVKLNLNCYSTSLLVINESSDGSNYDSNESYVTTDYEPTDNETYTSSTNESDRFV